MKLMGNCNGNRTCDSNDFSRDTDLAAGDGDACGGGGEIVAVGIKLDSRSRELLTWALVKIAKSGDRVIALHVIDSNTDRATLLSLVKTFNSLLAAYEGFCYLKQVDIKLKLSRGTPVRKILAREAISCGAVSLIVGTSETRNAIKSSISVAKYCARKVGKDISVIAADNGKIFFQREATTSGGHDLQDSYAVEYRPKRRKTMRKSPLNLPNGSLNHGDSCIELSSSSSEKMVDVVASVKHEVTESHSRWALLRKVVRHNRKSCSQSYSKKLSVVQWVFKLQRQQSFAVPSPDHDHDQNISVSEICQSPDLEKEREKGLIMPLPNSSSIPNSTLGLELLPKELEGLSAKYSSRCRLFSYQEILGATSHFSSENTIGKGGSSKVYRGTLPDGKELAVKILKPSEFVVKQFVSEIEILTTLGHKNVISLFGFCFENNKLLLVYDLLSRGSLEDNLHGNPRNGNLFGWKDRYKAALGVAEALEHLHDSAADPIIHRDVKSSNILLSSDFEPKLSDFGLAVLASSSSYRVDNTGLAGTFGYLAPEYFMHGKVTSRIDVYAYGVVVLELLSGRKPIENAHPKGPPESLVMWAKQILKGSKSSDLLDPSLANLYDQDQLERMVLAATLCIRRAPQFRPQISMVVKLLQGDPEMIEWAKQEVNTSVEVDAAEGEQSATSIQSFINLALLNLEDDSLSCSSAEPTIFVEDYLQGRGSGSSSFHETPN